MENLLYGRSLNVVYDLKGAMRDRYASEAPFDTSKVLLDGNFKERIKSSPILIDPHSHKVLTRSMLLDTSASYINATNVHILGYNF